MICEICKHEFSSVLKLSLHLRTHNITSKKYFDKFLKRNESEGICQNENCSKITSFRGLKTGYSKFCSPGCVSKSDIVKKKKEKKSLKKYGTKHVFQAKEVIQKSKETCLKNLNVDNASKSDIVKKKKEKKSLKKYGTKHVFQAKIVKDKIKDTCLKTWNVSHNMKAQVNRDKVIKTNLKKYGVKWSLENKEVREKGKITSLKKYKTESPNSSDLVKKRKKQTCFKKYGVGNPFEVEDVKDKIKETNLRKYDNIIPSQCEKIKNKIKRTKLKVFSGHLKKILYSLNIELLDKEYINCYFKHNWKCLKCGNHFIQIWNSIQQGFTCPKCRPPINYSSSSSEKELSNFIKNETQQEIITNDRSLIYPLELDILIPAKKLAIEFNGLYWHSEKVLKKSRKLNNLDVKNYHLNKSDLCNEKGIQLIQIFEDEWTFKKEIVKSKLKQILGVNQNSKRIHARKCIVKEIEPKIKNEFLEEFHIQGKDASKIKLGAFFEDKLISIMTFGKGNISKGSKSKEGIWELNRFCSNSNYHIPGIAGKLLSYFKKNFADRRWSQGNLYYKLGFELEHITKPNYWYIKNFQRIHRFNLRKTKDDPKDILEWVLRQKEGYSKIWDCGNLKFKTLRK